MNYTLLLLPKKLKWKNWPLWLKGLFLFWPSLGPAYLFLTNTPNPLVNPAELNEILTNIEYQNYFLAYFIGLWSVNLVILGLAWIIGPVVSSTYRSYLKYKNPKKVPRKHSPKKRMLKVKKKVRRYPILVKK